MMARLLSTLLPLLLVVFTNSFVPRSIPLKFTPKQILRRQTSIRRGRHSVIHPTFTHTRFFAVDPDNDDAAVEEEVRLKIWKQRRDYIRSILRTAESLRNFRIQAGLVPEIDEETGKPIQSDGKSAVAFTAFAVAAGALLLRIGGRAALVSTLGLDFATDNPELKDNLDQVLQFADSIDPIAKVGLFVLAWTGVKVFCFDAGGVVLALASGILFGGVLQGAVVSALAATVGSIVCWGLAQLDTPLRKKALELLDENPSLRGIERVVAEDGFKAILTLRLAPILPIPLGMYNYIYGVTNVPLLDFSAGIFLGSLKPYLLDSYLGFFGKTLVDGTAADATTFQDIILLAALGVSVLIGVFASQLATETWDSVAAEVEAEQKAKQEEDGVEEDDGIVREVFGVAVPEWLIGFQLSLQQADARMNRVIYSEVDARVWNYTSPEGPPRDRNPAFALDSPETTGANEGLDIAASLCDGLVLSPLLFKAFFRYADPLLDAEEERATRPEIVVPKVAAVVPKTRETKDVALDSAVQVEELSKELLLERLELAQAKTEIYLKAVESRIEGNDGNQ